MAFWRRDALAPEMFWRWDISKALRFYYYSTDEYKYIFYSLAPRDFLNTCLRMKLTIKKAAGVGAEGLGGALGSLTYSQPLHTHNLILLFFVDLYFSNNFDFVHASTNPRYGSYFKKYCGLRDD